MPMLRSLARNLFRGRSVEQDLRQEVRAHFELLVDQHMAKGLDATAARRAAHLELGGTNQVMDAVRDVRRGAYLEQMWRDVTFGVRMLSRDKGWTAVIVISLALGIGANTALFSAMNGLLLRTLPVRDPDGLVRFRSAGPNDMRTDVLVYGFTAPDAHGRQIGPTFSYPMYVQFVANNRTLSDVFACAPFGQVNMVINGHAEIATGFLSSGNYYRALGVTARLGRTITPDDDRPTAAPVAVISSKYWMSRFGGSPDAVGAVAHINNVPVTIIGVLPPDFTGVEAAVSDAPDVSVPLALEPQVTMQQSALQRSLLGAPNFWWLHVMGRLKPGVTIAQVQDNLTGVFQDTARTGFEAFLSSLPPQERSQAYLQGLTQVPGLVVDSGSHGIYDVNTSDLRAVLVLTVVVVLVLLIVCANVANLLLSRSAARQRELLVRLALGASRGRLVRQLLTESLLLAGIGGALGLFVGRWGQGFMPNAAAQASPFDWRVMVFIVAVSTVTGVVFGIAPALRATGTDVHASLKVHSANVTRSRSTLGKALVVAQITISLVLLVGAGLFLRTLTNLRHVDVGFDAQNVMLFRVSPALNRYNAQQQSQLYDQIGERVRGIGGVRSVAWSNPSLMSGRRFSPPMFIQGHPYARGEHDTIFQVFVSATFFETMDIPVLAGRGFTARDTRNTPPVVVINEAAARKYFPNEQAIGRRFGQSFEQSERLEIIGIVRDANYNTVRDGAVPTMYTPYAQARQGTATFEVRTAGNPLSVVAGIREAVTQADPNLPIISMTTQVAEIESRFLQEKVFAQAYVLFGGLALLVAAIGVFGLMSYSVSRRTHEIGLRMALGAEGRHVLRLVMRESMALAVMGVTIGIGGALAAGRVVSNLLFGVAPTDPMTIAGATILMLFVAALAGFVPAKRASRVDPMVALRCE